MGEPFTLKDMEATGDVARSLEQYVENSVTRINDNVFKAIVGKTTLKYTTAEWQRFCSAFMCDEDVIDDFNQSIMLMVEKGINPNTDVIFQRKFLKYFRPQYEKKKRTYAQIIQLAGMGNLERPKKKAEDVVQKMQFNTIKGLI